MQRSEAVNERCPGNRDALKIALLNLYVRKVLFKIFEKYLWMSLFLVKVAGLGQEFYQKWTSSQVFFKEFVQKNHNTYTIFYKNKVCKSNNEAEKWISVHC